MKRLLRIRHYVARLQRRIAGSRTGERGMTTAEYAKATALYPGGSGLVDAELSDDDRRCHRREDGDDEQGRVVSPRPLQPPGFFGRL